MRIISENPDLIFKRSFLVEINGSRYVNLLFRINPGVWRSDG
jgi:hypothetical protein